MEWFIRAFIRASLAWLAAAITVGVAMVFEPAFVVYRTAHVHLALVGFVLQMIYGFGLFVIPKFFGQKLRYPRMAAVQFWCAQPGIALLAIGFGLRVRGHALTAPIIITGSLLSAVAAGCFVVNLWRTIDASPMGTPRAQPRGRPIATVTDSGAH